jgi:hypothetical protein
VSSAKYIIFNNNTPFVVPEHICLWTFYNTLMKARLVGVATSAGKCYYDPKAGWVVFKGSQNLGSLDVPCKYKEDAEVLNRQLFI